MPKLATIAAFGFPDFNPVTLLRLYRRMGCQSCQFYRNPKNPPAAADARRIAQDSGLPIDSIHGVFGPEFDPSSPQEECRRAAIDAYRLEGDLALELGGPRVVVHPAPMAKEPSELTPQVRAARVDPLRRSLADLALLGERSGVVYLIENIPPNYLFGSDAIQLAMLVRQLNHPAVRMCFDTGHAYMVGSPAAALEACRDVVSYFHVHDNDSRTDAHLIPGRGTLPWRELARVMARFPDTPAMLELFAPEPEMESELTDGLPQRLKSWLALA